MQLNRDFNNSNDSDYMTEDVAQAAHWLKQGQLLTYPTESVWGIGCDAYNKRAVEKILAIKNRPIEKGMIVITDSAQRIAPLLQYLSDDRQQQIINSWRTASPTVSEQGAKVETAQYQATTWLLPVSSSSPAPSTLKEGLQIPKWITGAHSSVAVRVIAHPLIAQLCQQMVSRDNPFGLIVSTSCNPSGQPPAESIQQAYRYFSDAICYLEGETLGYTLPSQIRDAETGEVIRL